MDDVRWMTELHNACKEGNLRKVKESLEQMQPNPSEATDSPQIMQENDLYKGNKPYGNTPLHLAVLFEHVEIVAYLKEKHSTHFKHLLSKTNAVLDTPVHIAARHGNLQ